MGDLSPGSIAIGAGSIAIGGGVAGSVLVTGSHNVILQAEQVLIGAAQAAQDRGRDPARMLRILAVLAAPVHDPRRPDRPPVPLDLRQEWHGLAEKIRESGAPILLARLLPPTLDALRRALSPRAAAQDAFPHILHFSGHAWAGGLLLEDELGQVHEATTAEIREALRGLPRPLDLVVLNGCESAADVHAVAQALVEAGLARAAVGHTAPVLDPQAVAFAARLYAELSDGFPLREAVARAQEAVTTHAVALLGDGDLRFEPFTGGEPWIDDRRPRGNLPDRPPFFFGRGPQLVATAEALAHPPAVVLLSGPAAIGKSTLALEAAHRNAWRFPGGVAFAEGPRPEEGRAGTAEELLNRLADGLGLRPEPGRAAEALLFHAAQTPTLLLLDNVETLPPQELARLRGFLARLGEESAAIVLSRTPLEALEDLPHAYFLSLHEGIEPEAALHYAFRLAAERNIPLTEAQAAAIARAADGHPRLVELLVAGARRRDLAALLREVEERRGDFRRQLETLYDWSARRLEEAGQREAWRALLLIRILLRWFGLARQREAWRALLLFPGGVAPEALLRAAAGEEGPPALREAALADFDPALQAWRWHGTVGEYAGLKWPLTDAERRERLGALLPAWTAWLEGLPPETPETAARLEAQQANLDLLLTEAAHLPAAPVRALLEALHRVLPAPDRTLALRPFAERLYRTWAERATAEAERAAALNMLGVALSALGRREEALKATEEAVAIRRRLAAQHPEAFLPYLAISLNHLGDRLSEMRRPEEARRAYEEAVRTLAPFFLRLPQAFADRMADMVEDYRRACAAAGVAPDEDLLRPIEEILRGRR